MHCQACRLFFNNRYNAKQRTAGRRGLQNRVLQMFFVVADIDGASLEVSPEWHTNPAALPQSTKLSASRYWATSSSVISPTKIVDNFLTLGKELDRIPTFIL